MTNTAQKMFDIVYEISNQTDNLSVQHKVDLILGSSEDRKIKDSKTMKQSLKMLTVEAMDFIVDSYYGQIDFKAKFLNAYAIAINNNKLKYETVIRESESINNSLNKALKLVSNTNVNINRKERVFNKVTKKYYNFIKKLNPVISFFNNTSNEFEEAMMTLDKEVDKWEDLYSGYINKYELKFVNEFVEPPKTNTKTIKETTYRQVLLNASVNDINQKILPELKQIKENLSSTYKNIKEFVDVKEADLTK